MRSHELSNLSGTYAPKYLDLRCDVWFQNEFMVQTCRIDLDSMPGKTQVRARCTRPVLFFKTFITLKIPLAALVSFSGVGNS